MISLDTNLASRKLDRSHQTPNLRQLPPRQPVEQRHACEPVVGQSLPGHASLLGRPQVSRVVQCSAAEAPQTVIDPVVAPEPAPGSQPRAQNNGPQPARPDARTGDLCCATRGPLIATYTAGPASHGSRVRADPTRRRDEAYGAADLKCGSGDLAGADLLEPPNDP